MLSDIKCLQGGSATPLFIGSETSFAARATTDEGGSFTVEGMAPGVYSTMAS